MSTRKKDSEITWQDIDVGAVIRTPGNAAEYKTGDWLSLIHISEPTRPY